MHNQPTQPTVFTKQQGQAKAESYCAYQERCHFEVRNKLYEWGLHKQDVEEIITELIQQGFLNEERFAIAYSLGKFRMKSWGKKKIKQGLKLKRIPDRLIAKALNQLDEEDYLKTLLHLLEKKQAFLTDKDDFKRRYKLTQYAIGKGYEADLIAGILKDNQLS